MQRDVELVALGEQPQMWWRCGHSKTIHKGDRLILFRQGGDPKGVIGTGTAVSDWREYEQGGPKQPTRTKNEVKLKIETLIDPTLDEPLTPAQVEAAGISGVRWNVQESGTGIDDSTADRILKLWLPRSAVTVEAEELSGLEGEVRYMMVRHRKRERKLREAAIERAIADRGSLACEVPRCGFDFFWRYGEIAKGYAQVHHVNKLADRTHPSQTKLSELRVVCANCHAMIHIGGGSRDINTLIPQ
jgi:hypothetical protein